MAWSNEGKRISTDPTTGSHFTTRNSALPFHHHLSDGFQRPHPWPGPDILLTRLGSVRCLRYLRWTAAAYRVRVVEQFGALRGADCGFTCAFIMGKFGK